MERPDEPKFFSVPEVSQILGLSVSRTYQLVCSAECPFGAIGIGKRIIIPANSFYSDQTFLFIIKQNNAIL